MSWYSIIALFKHTRKDTNFVPQYEERVCIVQAKNIKSARKKFLNDFKKCEDESEIFLNEFEIHEIIESMNEYPIEVSSVCRVSDLPSHKYIEKYWYGLKPKNCKKQGWKHHWYKKGKNSFGCYNCQKIKKIKS